MQNRSPTVVIDPLAFELRARGGVSRVWSILLPKLVERGLSIRFTGGADERVLHEASPAETMRRIPRGGAIPAGLRRFLPYTGKADLFFPTYFRPCSKGIRNIQLVHDCTKELFYTEPKAWLARTRRYGVYRDADRLVSVSETTRLDLYRLFGENIGDRVRVIHNPVDFTYLDRCVASEDGSAEMARWLQQIGGRRFSVYIGFRAGGKNFREVRHLMRAVPELVLVAVGSPPTAEEQQMSRDFGGRIIYAGPCPDPLMFKLLKRSEFLFFPSLVEGFGLPLIESLYLGTPVVALDIQINREVSLGLITPFECGSEDSLRDAVGRARRLPHDHPLLQTFIDRYDPGKVADRYMRTIMEVS